VTTKGAPVSTASVKRAMRTDQNVSPVLRGAVNACLAMFAMENANDLRASVLGPVVPHLGGTAHTHQGKGALSLKVSSGVQAVNDERWRLQVIASVCCRHLAPWVLQQESPQLAETVREAMPCWTIVREDPLLRAWDRAQLTLHEAEVQIATDLHNHRLAREERLRATGTGTTPPCERAQEDFLLCTSGVLYWTRRAVDASVPATIRRLLNIPVLPQRGVALPHAMYAAARALKTPFPWEVLRATLLRLCYPDVFPKACRAHPDCREHPKLGEACFLEIVWPQMKPLDDLVGAPPAVPTLLERHGMEPPPDLVPYVAYNTRTGRG